MDSEASKLESPVQKLHRLEAEASELAQSLALLAEVQHHRPPAPLLFRACLSSCLFLLLFFLLITDRSSSSSYYDAPSLPR
jgi:hypothetical protein